MLAARLFGSALEAAPGHVPVLVCSGVCLAEQVRGAAAI